MLNTKIKSFNNISYYNKKFYNIKDLELKNSWNILFFFPYSFTYICPIELKELSLYKEKFKIINCNIYGISTDSHYVHKKWIENELNFINFPLISDKNNILSKNFNILNKKTGTCERANFILDPNLIIKSIEIEDSSIGRSIEYIYNKTKMLQHINKNINELCPYSWIYDKKSILIL